jgi:hypothetical protein
LKTIFYIEMDVADFIKAARTAETDDQKCELVARALSNGKESLRMWLMDGHLIGEPNGLAWASESYRKMLGPIILEQHIARPRECKPQKMLLGLNNPEWLLRAEARGSDARQWNEGAVVSALLNPETLSWLCARIDIASVILSQPRDERLHAILASCRMPTVCVLLELNFFALAEYVCRGVLRYRTALGDVRYSQINRHMCLAGGGVVLRVLLRRKRTRRQMRAMLATKCGLSPSDFASAGLY